MLGEVPDHPIDPSVGVVRVDDLDGSPIAIAFRYSAHPVTVGGRSTVASTDYPGPARDVLERSLGGLALFLQGCGGNMNPAVGIGWEIDCRDTKNRVGLRARRRGPEGRRARSGPIAAPASGGRSGTSRTSSSRPGSRSQTRRPHVSTRSRRRSSSSSTSSHRSRRRETIHAHWQQVLAARTRR